MSPFEEGHGVLLPRQRGRERRKYLS